MGGPPSEGGPSGPAPARQRAGAGPSSRRQRCRASLHCASARSCWSCLTQPPPSPPALPTAAGTRAWWLSPSRTRAARARATCPSSSRSRCATCRAGVEAPLGWAREGREAPCGCAAVLCPSRRPGCAPAPSRPARPAARHRPTSQSVSRPGRRTLLPIDFPDVTPVQFRLHVGINRLPRPTQY